MYRTTIYPALRLAAVAISIAAADHASATELVYTPVNPSFGGSPFNGAPMLSSAQATNKHEDPKTRDLSASLSQTPLQQFNDSLERSVLSQLAAAATGGILVGGRIVPGTVETGNFSITIADIGGGMLQITTTDKVSGASNSFQVKSQ
jgi:curli production assembly/transport component CsgF